MLLKTWFTLLCVGSQCTPTQGERIGHTDFESELKEVLSRGTGVPVDWSTPIEDKLRPVYATLPKNTRGLVSSAAARLGLHTYFAAEYGWLIRGLEHHGFQNKCGQGLHTVAILRDRAPSLYKYLSDARPPDCDYSFRDLVVLIAILERLILDESRSLLEHAYFIRNKSIDVELEEAHLIDVLLSYVIIFKGGTKSKQYHREPAQHMKNLQRLQQSYKAKGKPGRLNLDDMRVFVKDMVLNFAYSRRYVVNPLQPQLYSFTKALTITEAIARKYGRWQDEECRFMRAKFLKHDQGKSGRLPLEAFYQEDAATETIEYLRATGALDESVSGHPQVIVANYLQGPVNCVSDFEHFATCCYSSCNALGRDLANAIRRPNATADEVLEIFSNFSARFPSATVEPPQPLPDLLVTKLHDIAQHHGGEVPLHGRLFAQWLHYLMPTICPYPHILEDPAALGKRYWDKRQYRTSGDQKMQYSRVSGSSVPLDRKMSRWSDIEVLPLTDPVVIENGTRITQTILSFSSWLQGWLR